MRIVAHNGATIWGGAERATVRLLSGLKSRGHTVLLLCNMPVVAEQARQHGVDAELLVIAGDASLHHSIKLSRRLDEFGADAFIVGTYKKLFIATMGARMAGVKRIVARVGLESDTPRSWKYRFALRRWTDAVVVNSSSMVNEFAGLQGFGPSRVKVIHNGIAPPIVKPAVGLRSEFAIPASAFLIGTVARLAIQKRIDRLVEALALLPQSVHCVVAGEGTRRSEIESAIDSFGVRDRFHLLGHRDDVQSVIESLDLYVVSSDGEGFSNAMLEAMSLGKAVVSTRVSGAEDALAGRKGEEAAGLVVDRSAEALATGVHTLLDDPATRRRMEATAAQRARTEFSFEKMINEWEAILQARS